MGEDAEYAYLLVYHICNPLMKTVSEITLNV